jgi:hypothetical protein
VEPTPLSPHPNASAWLVPEQSLTNIELTVTPCHQHALTSSQAQLAEAAGNHTEAASHYAEAARSWQQFGNVPERAYALLGQGRSLHTLGDSEAGQPLRVARELFALMGYRPALEQTDALLQQAQAAAR